MAFIFACVRCGFEKRRAWAKADHDGCPGCAKVERAALEARLRRLEEEAELDAMHGIAWRTAEPEPVDLIEEFGEDRLRRAGLTLKRTS